MNKYSVFEDNELISAFQREEEWAGEEIYCRYFKRVLKVCLYYLKIIEDAEDATQDIMYKIILRKKILGFRGEGELWSWIRRVAVNLCLEVIRERKQRREVNLENQDGYIELEDTMPSKEKSPEEQLQQQERQTILCEMTDKLVCKYKWAVYFTVWLEYSNKEAARLLRIPAATVGIQRYRGLRNLKVLLNQNIYFKEAFRRTVQTEGVN